MRFALTGLRGSGGVTGKVVLPWLPVAHPAGWVGSVRFLGSLRSAAAERLAFWSGPDPNFNSSLGGRAHLGPIQILFAV